MNESEIYFELIEKMQIKQCLIVIKIGTCPVNRCGLCEIDELIKCNENHLSVHEIISSCKKIISKVPQEKLFEVAL